MTPSLMQDEEMTAQERERRQREGAFYMAMNLLQNQGRPFTLNEAISTAQAIEAYVGGAPTVVEPE